MFLFMDLLIANLTVIQDVFPDVTFVDTLCESKYYRLLKLKHNAECNSERQPNDVSIVDLSQERPRLRTNACPAITTSTISLFNCELMRPTVPDELLLMHNFSVYPAEH